MMAIARSRVKAENVTFSLADITQPWQIENGSVDLVACNLILEHIEDLGFVFSEAARSLSPRGNFFCQRTAPLQAISRQEGHLSTGWCNDRNSGFRPPHHGFSGGSQREWTNFDRTERMVAQRRSRRTTKIGILCV
jgi:SAM-dependent methyltransferase